MHKRLKRLGWILLVLPLFYLWLGFLAAPGLGLHFGNQLLTQYSNQPAHLQRLEFNPLSLQLRLWHFRLGAEQPLLALDAAHARLDWKSLLHGRVHLTDVLLEQPYAHIELNKSRQLTLLDAFDLPEPAKTDTPQQDPFPLTLELARIEQGSLSYVDTSLQQPVDMQFADLQAELHQLSLDRDDATSFSLQFSSSDGAQVSTSGIFSLQQLTSSGSLQATGVELASWWPYVLEQLPLHLQQGSLQLNGNYQLQLAPDLQLQVNGLDLQLDNLSLSDADTQQLLGLARLQIGQAGMDLAAQRVSVTEMSLLQLKAPLLIDAQGRLNWEKVAPPARANKAPPSEKGTSKGFKLADIPWHLQLQRLTIADSQLSLDMQNQSEPVNLQFTGINAQLDRLDSRSSTPTTLQLDTRFGEQGNISLAAQANPQSLAASASLKTRDIDLRAARAWIRPYARIELLSALVDTDLQATFKSLQQPDFAVSGEINMHQLHIRDQAQNRDLLKWQSLQLEQLSFAHVANTSKLVINRIRAQQPYARLVISENLETNISQLLIPQPEGSANTGSDTVFTFELGEVLVENGSANFADYSLQPHFATAIQTLNGRIGNLASDSKHPTPVNITGAVDNYAPVKISGSLTPFDPLQQLDITTEFKRVELTALTPYSGKFAGYRIHKGRLNMELHYQVNNGQLDASNTVLLEQLQLGEKVASADAIDLPVHLAVAMLKDTKGNISIQLPVKGDLNSPEFSVMPIVWQTLRNLLTRAVSSPFRMLASIGKAGDKDLGQIPFTAGSAELQADAAGLLDNLATALLERPMLQLNIEGTSAQALDGPALAERVLQRRYQELTYRHLQERGKPLPKDIYSIEVPEKSRDKLLEEIYATMLAEGKVAAMPSMPRKERHDWQRQQVLKHMAGDPLFLRWLAQQRAAAIRAHLVEHGGIAVERLYLVDVNEKTEAENMVVYSQLHLDVL